jgi:hypothetical protein
VSTAIPSPSGTGQQGGTHTYIIIPKTNKYISTPCVRVCGFIYNQILCRLYIDQKKKIRRDLLSFQKVIIFWVGPSRLSAGLVTRWVPSKYISKKGTTWRGCEDIDLTFLFRVRGKIIQKLRGRSVFGFGRWLARHDSHHLLRFQLSKSCYPTRRKHINNRLSTTYPTSNKRIKTRSENNKTTTPKTQSSKGGEQTTHRNAVQLIMTHTDRGKNKTKKYLGASPWDGHRYWGIKYNIKALYYIICNIYISFFLSFRFACHIVDTHGRAELCWPRSIIAGENQPGAGVYIYYYVCYNDDGQRVGCFLAIIITKVTESLMAIISRKGISRTGELSFVSTTITEKEIYVLVITPESEKERDVITTARFPIDVLVIIGCLCLRTCRRYTSSLYHSDAALDCPSTSSLRVL